MNEPQLIRDELTTLDVLTELRGHVGQHLVLGGRLRRMSTSGDLFQKDRWYEPSIPGGLYEERRIQIAERTMYDIGMGCALTIPSAGLFSMELVLSPAVDNFKSIFPTSGTYTDGRPYKRGDVSSESEYKSIVKTVRLGGGINCY